MGRPRYICIHGHFYQPPRENPWLEAIEAQDSAYPYHDWNERITAECYEPNAWSRILDGDNRIADIVNNYEKMSFNFGPTLLAWLESQSREVYEAILEADRRSQKRFSGHGSALAQVYNHMILPLAHRRDKVTQIRWGIADFEHRFRRRPEGLWLSETAVDLESLEILAEHGIRFTVLAPSQASRTRRLRARNWQDVSGARIDPSKAYLQRLPSGRSIVLFFYDGPISRAVAFEQLLRSGVDLAHRLVGAFSESRSGAELVHIATDGETYGHHHRHGEMALSYAVQHIEENGLATLTNYGEFLSKHPPLDMVEIFESTSWSCSHGVERWRADCGCATGGQPGWNQAWRRPLRDALDWLRDELAPRFERRGRELFRDPWEARDDSIQLILDRCPASRERFFRRHALRELPEEEVTVALKLLELERHALLMYTSCGWFFDELSGIETVQVIEYAGRALQLAEELFGDSLEARFLEKLALAKSNIPEHGNGRHLYEKFVKPAVVDWEKAGAHYAISSLFEDYPERVRLYCYEFQEADRHVLEAGRTRLLVGRATAESRITQETAVLSYGVLHLGDHNINCGVREYRGEETYQALLREVTEPFNRGDHAEVIRLFDREFGESTYSLRTLFRDEQRTIVRSIIKPRLEEAEAAYRMIYESNASMMRFLTYLRIPLHAAFSTAARFVLNRNLRRAFAGEQFEPERIEQLLAAAQEEGVALDTETLAFAARKRMEALSRELLARPGERERLDILERGAELVGKFPFEVDLSRVQNDYHRLWRTYLPEARQRSEQGEEEAREWLRQFLSLGEKLSMRVDSKADEPR